MDENVGIYCYDLICNQIANDGNCPDPDFHSSMNGIPFSVTWEKKHDLKWHRVMKIHSVNEMGYNSSGFRNTILESAFGNTNAKNSKPITIEDLNDLVLRITEVNKSTQKTIFSENKFAEGWNFDSKPQNTNHGVCIQIKEDSQSNSKIPKKTQRVKYYEPTTLLRLNWNIEKVIDSHIIDNLKLKFVNQLEKNQFIKSHVTIQLFETNKYKMKFSDYSPLTYSKDASIPNNALRAQSLKSIQSKVSKSSYSFYFKVIPILIVIAVIALALRIQSETYDKDFDDFQSNYAILGVSDDASYAEVKKAFYTWSLDNHPDKKPGCKECEAEYIRRNEAYTQITDFHKGKLKLVRRGTGGGNNNNNDNNPGRSSKTGSKSYSKPSDTPPSSQKKSSTTESRYRRTKV